MKIPDLLNRNEALNEVVTKDNQGSCTSFASQVRKPSSNLNRNLSSSQGLPVATTMPPADRKAKPQQLRGAPDSEETNEDMKENVPKDEPNLKLKAPEGVVKYFPYVAEDPEQVQKLVEFNVHPPNLEMHKWTDTVPYANEKKRFALIGRAGFYSML
jgi:hypothetical protein